MKKYFLHDGSESSGPFTIEELKEKNIVKTTPVWFDGLEHWKIADDIPELTRLFVYAPPPFITTQNTESTPKTNKILADQKILGLSKNTFIILSTVLILAIGTTIFNNIQESRRRELEIKNHKTEVENYQYILQQKEIEEQKKIVAEHKKREAERRLQERKHFVEKRIPEIEALIETKNLEIEELETKLNDASSFKFLRTPEEKKIQIDLLKSEIESLKNEVIVLKNEFDKLKLEQEKQIDSLKL
jgi:hypothetical protein